MATKMTGMERRPETLGSSTFPGATFPRRDHWQIIAVLIAALVCLVGAGDAPAASKSPVRKVKYGAIAMDRETRAVGYSYDFLLSRDAKREALKQCGSDTCEVMVAFRSACGVIAEGKNKLWTATGATRQEAQAKVLRRCGKNCPVLAWACTR